MRTKFVSQAEADAMKKHPMAMFDPTEEARKIIASDDSFFDVVVVPDDDPRMGTSVPKAAV